MTRIRMWYHVNLVYIIRKVAAAINSDAFKPMINKHTKMALILLERLGYELSEKGKRLVEEL